MPHGPFTIVEGGRRSVNRILPEHLNQYAEAFEDIPDQADVAQITPTERSQSIRGKPTGPYQAPSSFAIPQDWDGVGDGLTDDTTALQSLFTAMGNEPNASGLIQPGEWTFLSPIAAAANSTIVGEKSRSKLVMAPDAGWTGTGSRAAIEIVGQDNVTIRDLVIDGQGADRAGAKAIAQHILISNSRNGLIENVTFRGGGYIGGSPTGPYLAMVAADDLADFADYDSMEVGPLENWKIRNCTFEQADSGGPYFAIRLVTNWLLERATDDFTNYAVENVIEYCRFLANATGEGFDWNSIELAGGGTIFNEVAHNHFWGRTLSHVDFDKGCSYNTAHHNVVHSGGKSTSQVSVTSNKLAVFNDHGMSATYMNVGNTFHHNRIHDAVNLAESETTPAAINLQHTDGHISEWNSIDNVQNATLGSAFYLDDNTPNARIEHNTGRNIRRGIRSKSGGTRTNIKVRFNDFDVADEAIAFSGSAGTAPTGGDISHNRLKTSSTTLHCLSLGAELTSPIVDANTTEGGETGLGLGSAGTIATANVSRGAIRGVRATGAGMRLIGNDAVGSTSNILYGAGIALTEVGNSWQRKETSGTAAPTTGTWVQGDRVWNTAPASAGFVGWVCVSGGTPGTWKTFGLIS